MTDYATRELYCPQCGERKPYPICCTKEMELDETTFFCNICGKERPLPKHCGVYMKIREKGTG